MTKKCILNADDFGMDTTRNNAVLDGYLRGFLKSTSLTANGGAFEDAVKRVIPACSGLGIGVHLNIIEGKALTSKLYKLTNESGSFNNSYIQILLKSEDSEFINQSETEFRAQIERVLKYTKISHIDSHVHVHSIPRIFELVCKLACEYDIKQVRSQFEKFYMISNLSKHTNLKYPINLIKIALLDLFTVINKKNVLKYGLNTNDYVLGVGYTSMMDSETVLEGLAGLKNYEDITAEVIIHPKNSDTVQNAEYLLTKDTRLRERIEAAGFAITNYIEESKN